MGSPDRPLPLRGPGGVPLVGARAKQQAMRDAVAKLATTADVIEIATKTTRTLGRDVAKTVATEECQRLLSFLIATVPEVRCAMERVHCVKESGRPVPPGPCGFLRWRIHGWLERLGLQRKGQADAPVEQASPEAAPQSAAEPRDS